MDPDWRCNSYWKVWGYNPCIFHGLWTIMIPTTRWVVVFFPIFLESGDICLRHVIPKRAYLKQPGVFWGLPWHFSCILRKIPSIPQIDSHLRKHNDSPRHLPHWENGPLGSDLSPPQDWRRFFVVEKKIAPGKLGFAYPFLLVLGGWLTNLFEKYAQVKLDHRNPGLDGELPPSDAWKKIPKNTPDNGSRITYANPKSLLKMMLVRTSHLVLGNKIISYLPNGGELMNPTWRIIPFSKWLVTPIYKAFRPFGRGRNPLRGLTNHGY